MIPDYTNLYNTLNQSDQQALERRINQIDDTTCINTVEELKDSSFYQKYDPSSLSKLTAIFLKAVKENRLSVAQYATFNLMTTAIRDLVHEILFFTAYQYKTREGNMAVSRYPERPSNYDPLNVPQNYQLRELTANCADPTIQGANLIPPMLKKFLDLDDEEWGNFLNKMDSAPASEKSYMILTVPEIGHWSVIVPKIRGLLKCFQDQNCLVRANDNTSYNQRVFLIPTFSMLQAFVDVKGEVHKNGRRLTLIPTFGLISSDKYAEHKWENRIPLGLFFPQSKTLSNTRVVLDGHREEGWLAAAVHDIYHTLRELQMNKTLFSIRQRWYEIAKAHPNNQKIGQQRPISEILLDGELIYSFPKSRRSPFRSERANEGLQNLLNSLSGSLDPELKREFIRDIADNEEEWKKNYHFSLEDLSPEEQRIYHEVKLEQAIIPNLETPDHTFQTLVNPLPRLEQIRLQEAFENKNESTLQETVQMLTSLSYILPRDPSPALFRERAENVLYSLKMGRITLSQLATFHLFEMAMREIIENPSLFIYRKVLENGCLVEKPCQLTLQKSDKLSDYFNFAKHDASYTDFLDNGELAGQPTFYLKSFFHFNDEEWSEFLSQIEARPTSEQSFLLLELPAGSGVWSNSMRDTQKMLHCFQNQTTFVEEDSYEMKKEVFLAPSFSMFEIFFQIKSKKRNTPISLVPSYKDSSSPDAHSAMKANDSFVTTLYFPSSDPNLNCSKNDPNYIIKRDGFSEGSFTYFMDLIYLALKEAEISPEWNLARIRLASLAKLYSKPAYTALIREELKWGSYPDDTTSVFKSKLEPQIFGDLFHEESVKESLLDSVKEMMIQDMVDHADEWEETFNLGKDDLREPEQKIYDRLKQEALIS